MRRTLLVPLLLLGLGSLLRAQIQSFPAQGMVLSGGKRLRYWTGGKIMVGASARSQAGSIPSMRELLTKPPRGLFRLERNRRYYRDKELKGRQLGTIGKGILTEVLYKKGRKHTERSKARSQKGKGSSSAVKSLLKGLFK